MAPKVTLHVAEDQRVLFGLDTVGEGAKVMWLPDKGAFRAGAIENLYSSFWNPDTIGLFSFAAGYNTLASGNEGATALGSNTRALGDLGATAFGFATEASGNLGATALGHFSKATGGAGATALGTNTTASGTGGASALGVGTTASGNNGATAMGFASKASGNGGATALGFKANATGNYGAVALGDNTLSNSKGLVVVGTFNDTLPGYTGDSWDMAVGTEPLFIVGNGDAESTRSTALTILKNGNTGIATMDPKVTLHVADSQWVLFGADTVGEGAKMMWIPEKGAFRAGKIDDQYGGLYSSNWNIDSIGLNSFAAGLNTKASGENGATALGSSHCGFWRTGGQRRWDSYSVASGDLGATALGYYSVASGYEGCNGAGIELRKLQVMACNGAGILLVASGYGGATALGCGTEASGEGGATALGSRTIANSSSMIALGSLNDTLPGYEKSLWKDTDPILMVGNGYDIRSTALTILKNGNTGIATMAPKVKLHVADSQWVLFGADTVGEGAKMMWIPEKGAFRAGKIDDQFGGLYSSNWNIDSIGLNSFAAGLNTKASGEYGATALGSGTEASGKYGATALGYSTKASGYGGATALGRATEASGEYGATALGSFTKASGDLGATALGYYSVASGYEGATALGRATGASGVYGATAMGYFSVASGGYGGVTALGYGLR
jgi:hypothetical protein